jgi:hypothetical protein
MPAAGCGCWRRKWNRCLPENRCPAYRPVAPHADSHHRPGTAGAGGYRLIGALTARFTAYLDGWLATTREEFIDYGVDMLLSRVSSD